MKPDVIYPNLLCEDNLHVEELLTVGNVYAMTGVSKDGSTVYVVDDAGFEMQYYMRRFRPTKDAPTVDPDMKGEEEEDGTE